MLCAVCHTRPALSHLLLGYLPCQECQTRLANLNHPGSLIDLVPQRIKNDRRAGLPDTLPAHRKGHASREFRDRYGAVTMQRQGFSNEEIKNATYVWNSETYYSNH